MPHQQDLLAFTGVVITGVSGPEVDADVSVGGSCFLFRSDHVALTAAHCVPETVDRPDVVFPRSGRVMHVREVIRHPAADAALLIGQEADLDSPLGRPEVAPVDGVGNVGLGEEFACYGYPVDGPSIGTRAAPQSPTPRLFKGHYQRFMPYTSPKGYTYMAGELNMAVPGGLSGSPLIREGSWLPTGIATGTTESYTVVDSLEEVQDGDRLFRVESRKVITYGIALMLYDIVEWLNDVFPSRADGGWLLRRP